MQLLVDALHVRRDRVDAAPQLVRRRFVVVTLDQQLQQPRLVSHQVIVGPLGQVNGCVYETKVPLL